MNEDSHFLMNVHSFCLCVSTTTRTHLGLCEEEKEGRGLHRESIRFHWLRAQSYTIALLRNFRYQIITELMTDGL